LVILLNVYNSDTPILFHIVLGPEDVQRRKKRRRQNTCDSRDEKKKKKNVS